MGRVRRSNGGTGGITLITNNTERVSVNSSGAVGIGTTNPGATLDVRGNGAKFIGYKGEMYSTDAFTGQTLPNWLFEITPLGNSWNGDGGKICQASSIKLTAEPLKWSGGSVNIPGAEVIIEGGKSNRGSETGASIIFKTYDAERMRITPWGNVGIGTTNARCKFDVMGFGNGIATDYWVAGAFGAASDSTAPRVVLGSFSNIAVVGAHTSDLTQWANLSINPGGGNVGIGYTNSTHKLAINQQDSLKAMIHTLGKYTATGSTYGYQPILYHQSLGPTSYNNISAEIGITPIYNGAWAEGPASRMSFKLNSTANANNGWGPIPDVEVMTLNGFGNVGIGTTNPGAKLHVEGNLSLTTNLLHRPYQFTVGGDPNTYYSVFITPTDFSGLGLAQYRIGRGDVHLDGTWWGTFHLEVEFRGSGTGNGSTTHRYRYRRNDGSKTFVANMAVEDNWYGTRHLVWLRGATTYNFQGYNCYLADWGLNNPIATVDQRFDVGANGYFCGDWLTNLYCKIGLVGIGNDNPRYPLHLLGGSTNAYEPPSIGTAAGSSLVLENGNRGFGMVFGSSNYGIGFIQQQRIDAANNDVYPLCINPRGGKVGVGTTNPGYIFQVEGAWPQAAITGDASDVGIQLVNRKAGGRNITIGSSSTGSGAGTSQFYIYDNAVGLAMTINTSLNMWIAGTLTQASDQNLKKNIIPLSRVLNTISQLNPVSYHFKTQKDEEPLNFGLIAQEVQQLLPNLVSENNGDLALSYIQLVPLLIKGMQEQQQTISDLESRLSRLEALLSR